jgi:hypothetical protein
MAPLNGAYRCKAAAPIWSISRATSEATAFECIATIVTARSR